MSKLIYVDTNVYIDLFENRQDRFRPLGEIAAQLFQRGLDCEFNIILSPVIISEAQDNSYEKELQELIFSLRTANKIVDTEFSYNDKKYARELSNLRKTPFKDTCHAIIAARMKADFLVTRNIKDFENISDIITIISPDYI